MNTTIAGSLNAVAGAFGQSRDEGTYARHESALAGMRNLDLRPALSRLYEAALRSTAKLGQAGSDAANSALGVVQRLWAWIRSFLSGMARRMGGAFSAPRKLTPAEARGEVKSEATIRQSEGVGSAPSIVPVDVQKEALEENASALADHILLAGPSLTALHDRSKSLEYVTSSLVQLQRVVEHNERHAQTLQAKAQELLLKIAQREGTSPAVISGMIESNSLLDKSGEYAALQQGIRSSKGSAQTAREAMVGLVAAARSYDVPMEELDREASKVVTDWDAVRAKAEQNAGAQSFGGEGGSELMLGERLGVAANDSQAPQGGHISQASAANLVNIVHNIATTKSIPSGASQSEVASELPDIGASPFVAAPVSKFAQLAAKSRERREQDEDWGQPPERPHDA